MSTNEPQKPSVPTGSPPTTRFCLVRHGTTGLEPGEPDSGGYGHALERTRAKGD